MLGPSKWSFDFRFLHNNPACISLIKVHYTAQNYLPIEHVKSRDIQTFATCTVLNLHVSMQSVLSADVP